MRKSERDQVYEDRRHSKLVEKQEKTRKMSHKDRHYHTIDPDEEDEHRYDQYVKGKTK